MSPSGKRARGSDISRELSLGQSDNIAIERVPFTEPSFKMFYLGEKKKKIYYLGIILVYRKLAKVVCIDSSHIPLTQLLLTFCTAMV